ncbi:MAG: sensor domain-containing phosphodiesterase [Acidimicrobiia bacterium]|nr:sensor domain-containing phosphodiesterase [Acidimicrobiia bacterium]
MLVLALIPLLAAGVLVLLEANRARAEKSDVEVVAEYVTRLVLLTDLRISLLDERNLRIAAQSLNAVRPDSSAIGATDIEEELAVSRERVDHLVATLQLPDIADQVERVRSSPDPATTDTIGAYGTVESLVAGESDLVMNRLITNGGDVKNGGRLITAIRILEATTTARQALSAEMNHLYTLQSTGQSALGDKLDGLIIEQSTRRRALDDIQRIGPAGSSVASTLEIMHRSPDIEIYENSTAQLLVVAFDTDGVPGSQEAVVELANDTLRVTSATTDLYLGLVNSAGVDALNASASLQADAVRRDQRALSLLTILILSTTLLAWFAYRSLLAPISNLALRAQQVRDGHTDADPVPSTGPVEVRQAISAINEAADQLKLAERQATALASGDLGHSSLGQPILGALGASLQQAVRTLASSLAEREAFRRRMTYEATHDGLTQLANRRAAMARLEQGLARTERTGTTLAVLLFDLDWFKDINDHRGHPAGDLVLQIIARRLSANARAGDHVGRLGGDEFVVIAEPVEDAEGAFDLAERISEVIQQPMVIDGASLTVGVSVGIALSAGTGVDAVDLLHDADLAVDQVKQQGKGGIEFCTTELRASMAAKADFDQAIRKAIADDEFVLHYQPLIDPRSGRCKGVESLIRWERPGIGLEPPAAFIPDAEESDLIMEIDNWVLRAAAEQLVKWEAARINDGFTIGVNISGRHLNSPSFVQEVLQPFHEYGIDPGRLVIEITESSLLDDLPSAAGKLTMLQSKGVKVAIDDFGTGFTSLAHLKSLPMDILKIDRSFTKDESSTSLVKLIVDIGHLLGVAVVAEGIETDDQADRLARTGADLLQGYLFGRPAPASESIWLGLAGPAPAAIRQS